MLPGININLGCGPDPNPDWIGVDAQDFGHNVVASITEILPFPDNHADQVMAIHCIEHIPKDHAPNMCREVLRILKPGGKFLVECPSLEKTLKNFEKYDIRDQAAWPLTFWSLYGPPTVIDDPYQTHQWCYTGAQIESMMYNAGFGHVEELEPNFHEPLRDMAWLGVKSPQWGED